ncbi:glycosyltransferase family protein [Oleidesulfovibrio alaskensis]|uniref:glycosyltransferase family protein n=1 Tax=Oleidesulfovibrio alaskensis TaxID=58180 RepID=UPI0003F70856|nr:glycosyltransferase [Oleidesulfovibrio alaskensis]
MSQTYNILMYSHDTYGLGHIRRTMTIAQALLHPDVNILILTGSPIAGRYTFPQGIDFVRIPGMIKQSNTSYVPHSIKVAPNHALDIRQEIITATAKAFDPAMFIVDKVPVGLKGEVRPVLEWFRTSRPETKVILGLRDILDDAATTRADWENRNYLHVIDDLYSEVWVYGEKRLYNPLEEYGIPGHMHHKFVFTGYLPRPSYIKAAATQQRRNGDRLVLVTAGGGGDGYPLLDCYMKMAESGPLPFRTVMVSGPFVPKPRQDELADRARRSGIAFKTFHNKPEKLMANADVVVSMGGYNTICEVLSQRKVTLVIPRDTPRMEQLIRARMLQREGLADFIEWDRMSPSLMLGRILALLENPAPWKQAMENFALTGLETIKQRLTAFRQETAA